MIYLAKSVEAGIASMIALKKLRYLDLARPTQAGRKSHLSAASALTRIKTHIYVVADDELVLGLFDLDHTKPGICSAGVRRTAAQSRKTKGEQA